MLRTLFAGLALASVLFVGRVTPASAGRPGKASVAPVTKELGGHRTRAEIIVDASPQEVYEVITSYADWDELLGDVASCKVKSGGRENATVQVRSRALGRKLTVTFDNIPDRLIRFRLTDGPRGARVHGSYRITPVGDGRSRITATLYLDVVGAAGLFVDESDTRPMRQRKLRGELTDLARYFDRNPGVRAAAR
ncbi:MAG TPA: SRPBCC family protein [Kofleriaceae bacterium]|jgi:ribosome-associated toxin RatA of RatAB toxin-antitoxin module|nr:SRPBCC family protein [Kofleriaceae bacterium]